MKMVSEEIASPGAPIVSEPSILDLTLLRARVVQAHRSGTAEELNAAVKALIDAGEKNPPAEAMGTLHRWGWTP
jgi:hypothetical protein